MFFTLRGKTLQHLAAATSVVAAGMFAVPAMAAETLPMPSALTQQLDAGVGYWPIPEKGLIKGARVRFGGISTAGEDVRMEVEVKLASMPFDGMGTHMTGTFNTGHAFVQKDLALPTIGNSLMWKWRARVVSVADPMKTSNWKEFGISNGEGTFDLRRYRPVEMTTTPSLLTFATPSDTETRVRTTEGKSIPIDIYNPNEPWSGADNPPQLDSVQMDLRCPSAACASATWKLSLFRMVDGVGKYHYSAGKMLPETMQGVKFDFPTMPSLYTEWMPGNPMNAAMQLRFECVANCPALSIHWPRIASSMYRSGFGSIETANGPMGVSLQVRGHILKNAAGIVGQYEQYSDGSEALLPEGHLSTTGDMMLRARLNGTPQDTKANFEVQLKHTDQLWKDAQFYAVNGVNVGEMVNINIPDIMAGQYRWRYRVTSAAHPDTAWRDYRVDGNTDFVVEE